MRGGGTWLVVLALGVAAPAAAQESQMGWQQAVAELASERTRAESCVALIKRNAAGNGELLAQGDWAYTEAKADMDGVIAGLVVALAEDAPPVSLEVLNRQLERAVTLRQEFCATALAMSPPTSGTKALGLDVLAKTLSSLIDAAKEIYLQHREEDVLARKTIQTQVESTRWRPFGEIAAAGS
jgi:hypothetical protein